MTSLSTTHTAIKVEGGVPDVNAFRAAFPLAAFHKSSKRPSYWTIPFTDAENAVKWVDQNHGDADDGIRSFASGQWRRKLRAMTRATAVTWDETPTVEGLLSTLKPVQKVVIAASEEAWVQRPQPGVTHRALVVADEPGMGKTLSSLGALRVRGQVTQRSVVVCPSSLTGNWVAEIEQHFNPEVFTPWIAESQTPKAIPDDVDTVVIGWDILSYWVEALTNWKPDALVVDEGHYGKSGRRRKVTEDVPRRDDNEMLVRDDSGKVVMDTVTRVVGGALRAEAAIQLARAVAKNHGLVMALTGTPIVNRPVELHPVLDMAGILHLFGGAGGFKDRYCGPKTKNIGGKVRTSYAGASHLLELHSRLASSGHYIRRTKEVLVDEGALQRMWVDGIYVYDRYSEPDPWLINGSDAEMLKYAAAVTEQRDFFTGRARDFAVELSCGIESEKVRRKVAAEGAKHLVRIGQLRKAAAEIKVAHVSRRVRELIASGEKVVIAAHHKEVVDAYADQFGGLKIKGMMSPKKIEEAKALFNERPLDEYPVLVLSVDAGKTGHTLCKQALHGVGPSCAHMIIAEQVWSPGDETQVQNRIWRFGQEREVHIANALLTRSIDMDIFAQRWRKRRVVNAAIDAIDPDLVSDGGKSEAGRIAQKLVYE